MKRRPIVSVAMIPFPASSSEWSVCTSFLLLISVHLSLAGLSETNYLQVNHFSIISNCSDIPPDEFYANQLDLFYAYTVELKSTRTVTSLNGLELATSSAVMELLANRCDLMDRSMYKVKNTPNHEFAHDEFCVPETSGNPCYVVHGATTILLDQRSGDIQQSALDAIAIGLENVGRVQSFDPNVIRAQFERPLGESLTSNSWSDQRNTTLSVPATATIAVAAASVSIVLVSFFWYGLVRRELRQHPDPNRRHPVRRPPSRPMRVIRGMSLGPPRKQRPFSRLDDVSHCPSGMISTDSSEERLEIQGPIQRHEPSPSIIWSVSDVTCDSGSFRSFVSITTSRLERIDEEEGDEDVDRTDEDRLLYELVERPRRNILGNEPPSGLIDRSDRMDQVLSMHSIQISSLEDDDLEQELEGCRFIPDEPCSAPTRGSLLSHRLKSALPGAEDLDISLEMLDDVKSIFSALSTSDDDDDDDSDDMVELRNSDIQDECRIQPLAGVSFGASLRDRDNHCQLDLMESTSFGRFGVEQAFTQMALSNSLSSQPAPDGTRPGGYLPTATMVTPVRNWKQEEGTQERLTENPSLTQGNSKLSYPAFQCQPEDRTIMVGPADDSLEGSIACSVPAPATADCAESVC